MTRLIALLSASTLLLAACGGNDAETASESATPQTATSTADTDVSTEEAAEANAEPERQVIPAPEGSLAGGPMILGDPDAPLTMVEYASTVCPACAYFHNEVMPVIKEKYVDTGKMNVEFREFPTAPQNFAYAGFYIARCAATDRGAPAYFAMLDTLFARQQEWAFGPTPGAELEKIAAQAGIDREGFQNCFYREDVTSAVKANIETAINDESVTIPRNVASQLGRSTGVYSTPTITIGGEHLEWDGKVETIEAAIEAKLAELEN